jgi:V/A-type H+-transporting ATPase subunit I
MSIVKMKKLKIMALRSNKDDLLRELMLMGCVEVSEPEELEESSISSSVYRDNDGLDQLKMDSDYLNRAIQILDKYFPEKSKRMVRRPTYSETDFLDEHKLPEQLAAARKLSELDEQLRSISSEESKFNGLLSTLRPWRGLTYPFEHLGTPSVPAVAGTIPANHDIGHVNTTLIEAIPESQLLEIANDDTLIYVLLVAEKSSIKAATEALRGCGFSPAPVNSMTGTAEENIQTTKQRLAELAEAKSHCLKEIESLSGLRNELKFAVDQYSSKITRADAASRLLRTENTVLLQGWLAAPKEKELLQLVRKYDCAYELSDPEEGEYPDVPVSLHNNRFTNSLNAVTEMYSLPAYGSLDPNPLMAPFFILFYGMMMADMGYGILMFFGCLIARRIKRPKDSMDHLLTLIQYCGVTTFLFGAATGSFFGDFLTQVVSLTGGGEFALPQLFSPLNDALAVLVGSLALGFIQVITGMAISFYKQAKRGQVLAAICNEGAWFLVFVCIGIAAVTGKWSTYLIVALVILVLTQGYGKKGVLGKITGLFGSLYNNITGFFSDILSYSRLMALMLAGAVIAQVFNTLGAITGNIIAFVIISIVGNALNFALNLLSCYVHDLRLQCLEFFGRFYEDGGKPFEPVKIQTKYVDIIREGGNNK